MDFINRAQAKCKEIQDKKEELDEQDDAQPVADEEADLLEETMAPVIDLLQEYCDNTAWWKEHFREGATHDLEEETIPQLLALRWKYSLQSGNLFAQRIDQLQEIGCQVRRRGARKCCILSSAQGTREDQLFRR